MFFVLDVKVSGSKINVEIDQKNGFRYLETFVKKITGAYVKCYLSICPVYHIHDFKVRKLARCRVYSPQRTGVTL